MTARDASVIAAFALNNLSMAALWFTPYMDRLRIKKWLLFLINALLLAGQALVYLWLDRDGALSLNALQLYRLAYFSLYLVMLFLVIRENFFKLLFVWFVSASYNNILLRVATFLELRFFGRETDMLALGKNNLILLCLLALTLPLMVLFMKRSIVPMLRAADNSVTRFIWLVPGFFLLNFFIYVADLRVEQISNARYMLLIIPLAGGIGISCYTLMRLLSQAAEKARLHAEITAAGRMMDLQREQYRRIIEDEEKGKAARHDLRHQLAVIRRYALEGDTEGAVRYCDELAGAVLHSERRVWCGNFAVNAALDHYLSEAERAGIQLDILLDIPEDVGGLPVTELCVIIGNLLENAVEASLGIPPKERFIHLRGRMWSRSLTITMDNGFDGSIRRRGELWHSRKREGVGIGLSSVQAICRKYGGKAEFETKDRIFRSSVMLDTAQADLANTV